MVFDGEPHDFKPSFSAVGCLMERDGSIVLLERQDHKPHGGTWGMPAGKVDPGESPEDAMIREMEQETGYAAKKDDLRFVQKMFVRLPEYDFYYYLYRLPLSKKIDVVLSTSEHKTFRWIKPQEALKMKLIPDCDVCIKIAYKNLA